MEEGDSIRKVLCTKPGGTGGKKRGRPKLRWWDELRENVAPLEEEESELEAGKFSKKIYIHYILLKLWDSKFTQTKKLKF
jgi:hypothetical protein